MAYARRPDEESRERCAAPDPVGVAMMVEAIAERLPEIRMEIVDDMPAEPDQVGARRPDRERAGRESFDHRGVGT
ncbi:hypothetical protein ACFWNR_17330 [Streptomyces virginiae]|uniref:hypothetical protein n=1 Tax=Streptomyces virginiae TaxID=1961 RepID=UPI0036591D43